MNNDLSSMLKKVLFFDFVIGIILAFVIFKVSQGWLVYFILGLFVAYGSLLLNTIITQRSIESDKKSKIVFIILGFVVRILLVCVIGILIYLHNTTNMIIYIVGYSIQFLSLIFYGLTIKE